MDLISAQYGWTDGEILDHTLPRLTQIVAAIQRRQWLDDLAHRRLETAKLRTLCAYIASTLQLAEGAENVMLTEAAYLSLGTGTEHTSDPAEHGRPSPATLPAARVTRGDLPDAPTPIRPGQAAPIPAGARPLPAEALGSLLTGGTL
jgi:hypothetical protein